MLYWLTNVKKTEPQIVTLSQPIKMIGTSIRTNPQTIFRDAQTVGERYKEIKAEGLIRNKQDPWGFVAVSKDFQDDKSWEYLLGDVVTSFDFVPEGLTCFEIPAGTYARFSLQPRSVQMWGLALGLLKKYIYSEWLPKSKYQLDNSIVGDFEYHDERSTSQKPEIDLYVCLKQPG